VQSRNKEIGKLERKLEEGTKDKESMLRKMEEAKKQGED